MMKAHNKRKLSHKGQSLAEYGLILALIAVVCIGALGTLGNQLNDSMEGISQTLGQSLG